MPATKQTPRQSRQDHSGAAEQSTLVVSMPDSGPADKKPFIERAQRFIGGEYRECTEYDLAGVGACLEIMENHRGCDTPFEQFVYSLLVEYIHGSGASLTPEAILESDFREFQESFSSAIATARMMNKRHPELVQDTPAEKED